MYAEHGGCPSGGVVVKMGYVKGKQCIVVANDATVKAGAWFPITGKKNLRAQEISIENKLPIIYLVDSAGVYLPMQDEIFPDKEHFGRIFRNNAVMSSMGITQISAVMGSCVAGGAYLPIMSDEALIVDKTARSYLVKAAIGESIDNETLGGATTHCEISGVTDYKAKDDKDALDKIKFIVDKIGDYNKAGFSKTTALPPKEKEDDIFGILPRERNAQYDMIEIIKRLVDNSEFEQYKEGYGKTILTGYARIDGWAVGIVANQLIIGNSYGAGNYAMCGKAYDPRLIVAWPSAELAVMSGNSAAKVLLQIETASLKKRGEEITPEKEAELFDKIKSRYDKQISPYYAAARIWTDAVINPLDTRTWISMGIEAANHAPIEKQFNMGVL
eukprot:maker-scaffold3003_size10731-snap-gene-0.0 protein:Tk09009 transcript:maker-scaffold3003_size10731-snap-gene-0.0-mRNA-1 annotation:"methylcrotonoyl- carboxylase"